MAGRDWLSEELLWACKSGQSGTVRKLLSRGADPSCRGEDDVFKKTPLHWASGQGHLDIVKLLISDGRCDVNSRDNSGDTPVHYACGRQHLDIVKCLITEGHCDVNSENGSGDTPLHEVWRNGHLNIIKCLITEGHCDVNIKDRSGDTPLHWACKNGHLNIVKCLITEGRCDVNIKGLSGNTPLNLACRNGHLNIVKCLITEGHCDVNIKDSAGDTPLHEACRKGYLDIVKWLITEGHYDVNSKNRSRVTPLHVACREGYLDIMKWLITEGHYDVNIKDWSGDTPLHEACRNGHLNIVKCLITEGHCDVNIKDRFGNTPLHEACWMQHLEVMKCLITEGHCDVNSENGSGDTPLHEAWRMQHLEVMKCLITEGHCDVNIKNRSGNTPLHWACWKGYLSIVKCLIAKGHCDVNIKDSSGDTPLYEACREGHLDIVKCLIMEGHCNVNSENGSGDTPLHEAWRKGHLDIVKCLITEGYCDVNSKNESGDTLLHEAWREGHLDIVKCLITEGHCDVNSENGSGNTPLQEACRNGHLNIVKFLITEGHCDVNIRDSSGNTLLYRACKNGHLNIVKFLITEGHCDVNIRDSSGNTLLYRACKNGHLNIVKFLIMEGHCDVNIRDSSGNTLLYWACKRQHLDIVKCLITEGHCDVNSENRSGDTPLQEAWRNGHLNIIKCLIMEGHCDVNIKDRSGDTLLHWACKKGHLDIVKWLITEVHCDVNSENGSGNTPLHEACRRRLLNVMRCLITEGHCDVNSENGSGNTPLHEACRWGYTEVVKVLLREGLCNLNVANQDGDTPLAVTPSQHPAVIRELLRHGAHAADIYQHYGKLLPEGCPRKPTESAVRVFIVGKQGMGKSTLTTALKKEGGIMTYVMKRVRQVSGIEINTAGIIPHDILSKTFGHATIYDFAGHEEFYSGHDVMLRSSIAGSPAVFLLVANLSLSDEEFRQSILSWLAFLENQGVPEDPKPHIIIVGSHADEATAADIQNKEGMVSSIVSSLVFSSFHFAGFVRIDCRYAESPPMTKLRKQLSESCSALRHKTEISVSCHCLYVYLLNQFQNSPAIKVREALSKVQEESKKSQSSESEILSCIPDDPTHLCRLLQDLHERGNILLLRDTENFENSWMILDREAILSEVTGTVFAPNPEKFKQYKNFATSTGVVPFSKIQGIFPDLDPDLIAEFLCHFEFCHEITDAEGKQLLQVATAPHDAGDATASVSAQVTSNYPSGCAKFFFFPGLVRIDTPEVWKSGSEYSYHSSWVLQSLHPDKFFTRRFLHVLILRLAFAFALAPEADTTSPQLPTIQRKCSIWKNGILWGDRSGTEALVEVVEGSRRINVMVRCLIGNEVECVHLRSALVQRILSAKDDLCSRVPTSESFLHPLDSTSYPLKSITEARYASCSEIAKAVAAGKKNVVDQSHRVMALETLLSFEPYACLGQDILRELFDEGNPNYQKVVSNEFLYRIADRVHQKKDTFIQLFNLPTTLLHDRMCHAAEGPTHKLVEVFRLWREHCKGSYQCLRRELDRFSAFAGRNPLIMAGCNTSSPIVTTSSESRTHQWSPEEVDETTLDIQALCAVNSELVSVAPMWMDLGLSLGLDKPVLDSLESNYPRDVNRCLTETLAKWLQQVRTARSWRTITHALIAPSINRDDLAHSVAMKHGTDTPQESDTRYQDVNSERLGISDLREVSDEMFTVYEWFHLGLSLGLSYDTLRTIEKDCHQDTLHCRTEMLKAWLKGVGGESSWRQLACALDSPLIRRTEIASMIATGHKV